ncbi:hypothetical protein DPMN_100420 [Dreissena polymorpha]|uniref:Uncharacterized protein n=1 Tax=Dreissena polymorpha TaxID=45954 RepID=A0A9D4R955_DREPO|nr:hypothetical protein DPMN_100420 [Dreissena polymorpha]
MRIHQVVTKSPGSLYVTDVSCSCFDKTREGHSLKKVNCLQSNFHRKETLDLKGKHVANSSSQKPEHTEKVCVRSVDVTNY